MVSVRLEGVVKWLGKTLVLRCVDLTVDAGKFFFVLGPSGCGKTTLLRVVAGFLVPDEGRVFFGDRDVTTVPPHKRNAAMVFQHYALFPHMTVYDNVAYGLRLRKLPRDEIDRRVRDVLRLVRLEGLEHRYPSQLSGGQQQRVALARAIAVHPDVLLLDEPLSNLDAKLRAEMRGELKALQRQLGVTAIYVTHDQKEALAMADCMAVMKDGAILQVGTPTDLYRYPASRFVAEFLGDANIWDGRIVAVHPDGVEVETPFGRVRCQRPEFSVQVGDGVWVMVRPEAVQVTTDETGAAENAFAARVVQATYLGEAMELVLRVRDAKVKALHFRPDGGLPDEVRLRFAATDLRLLPRDDVASPTR
ncbi:Spermidine/putrescine import ATP-binding protein PotA [bacterium HR17]|uniref:Spermidine/putrescine import ATP-binding protein PotA n=1 Tax=Candidatus Fervidibacter japonicus TaxID=2035412 RepID=A0A2H5XFB2_9BACT|nr:Spermidine/putrescine import ATP-binding protein PotA [bacterium HR17]